MAHATVTKRLVPQPPKEEIAGVQLSLTTEEVAVLLQVFEYIGGHPNKRIRGAVETSVNSMYACGTVAPRGYVDRVARALRETGIRRAEYTVRDGLRNVSFADVFTDE